MKIYQIYHKQDGESFLDSSYLERNKAEEILKNLKDELKNRMDRHKKCENCPVHTELYEEISNAEMTKKVNKHCNHSDVYVGIEKGFLESYKRYLCKNTFFDYWAFGEDYKIATIDVIE